MITSIIATYADCKYCLTNPINDSESHTIKTWKSISAFEMENNEALCIENRRYMSLNDRIYLKIHARNTLLHVTQSTFRGRNSFIVICVPYLSLKL